MDSQFIWNAILTIGMAIISALIALGAKYLSQIQTTLEKRMDTQDEKIMQITCDVDKTQEDLNRFKVLVQREFVNREEYIRTTQSLDAKMDRILSEIGKIQVNVAKLATVQEVKT